MLLRELSPAGQAEALFLTEAENKGPILRYLEFETIVGNADQWRKASAATGGKFRALDNDYAANKQTPSFASVALKIFGDKIETDIAHERRGQDIESVHMRNVLRFAKDLGAKFQYEFVNATGAGDDFVGIKSQVAADHVLSPGGANGTNIAYGQDANIEKLLGTMRELLAYNLTFWLADITFISRLTNIQNSLVTINRDELGNTIVQFGGVPMVPAGRKGLTQSDAKTLPATETKGTAANICQSVYAIRTEEIGGVAAASNTGLDLDHFGHVADDRCYRSVAEFDADIISLEDDALWRIEGINF